MSGSQAADEQLLRSIRRRRMAQGLPVMVLVLSAWWLLSRWIARRWDLPPDLVRTAIMLAFMVPAVVAPRWLNGRFGNDPRETPRLRWLIRERADRVLDRSRIPMIFGIGILLLVQCVMLLGLVRLPSGYSGSDGVTVAVVMGSLCLRWRPADLGDEGTQLRYLIAANRAFLVTLLSCLGALLLDAFRDGLLRPALEAALLAGSLTLQLSMFIGDRRTTTDGE